MKKAGIIGGIGPEATVEYYHLVIKKYRDIITDGSYPEILIHSIDMTKMIGLLTDNDIDGVVAYLGAAVSSLAAAGADFALLASNTPHVVFNRLSSEASIPMISIVEATRDEAQKRGLKKPGLLGTRFTMTGGFYQDVCSLENMEVSIPGETERDFIHQKIFSELVFADIKKETRDEFIRIIQKMQKDDGIDSIILGCTELPLILFPEDSAALGIPFLNTTEIHVDRIVAAIT